jgi:hypothetical protein
METHALTTLTHARCPKCHSNQAVLAAEWFGQKSYFCPDCENVWDVPPRAPERES